MRGLEKLIEGAIKLRLKHTTQRKHKEANAQVLGIPLVSKGSVWTFESERKYDERCEGCMHARTLFGLRGHANVRI